MFSGLSCKKVFFPASLIWIFALTLFFMSVPGVAGALELTVSPTGQTTIKQSLINALEAVKNAGGGKVYLELRNLQSRQHGHYLVKYHLRRFS